ncbi:Mevalonate kinase [Sorochytrium milnesiophthora]
MHVSAPGKTILFGEHAVVYGKTAIAAAVNLRTDLHLQPSTDARVTLHLPDINFSIAVETDALSDIGRQLPSADHAEPDAPSAAIKHALLDLVNQHAPAAETMQALATVAFWHLLLSIRSSSQLRPDMAMVVSLRSAIPVGSGLGSSASLSVCYAAALLQYYGGIRDCTSSESLALINKWAFAAEKILHGNPSGIDNSVATYGGAMIYSKGQMERLSGFASLRFLLINTNVPKNTGVQVAKVKSLREAHPTVVDPMLDAIHNISTSCCKVFEQDLHAMQRHEQLAQLVAMNQHLLAALGMSHPAIDTAVQQTTKLGFPSKLTGAGGGGCVLTLLPDDVDEQAVSQLRDVLQQEHGFDVFETELGCRGVHFHND